MWLWYSSLAHFGFSPWEIERLSFLESSSHGIVLLSGLLSIFHLSLDVVVDLTRISKVLDSILERVLRRILT